MHFTLFRFPIRVEPWFWISIFLLGGGLRSDAFSSSAKMAEIGIWMILAFFSVLIHELGHAAVGRRFGSEPIIVLQAFGGAAIMDPSRFTRVQHFLMVAAGPAASASLGLVALVALVYAPGLGSDAREALAQLVTINYWWTILNLLPVQPLDGGQLLRIGLGERRYPATCVIGVVVAVVVAIYGLRQGQVFLTLIMALFAFENWRAMRR